MERGKEFPQMESIISKAQKSLLLEFEVRMQIQLE